MRGGEIRSVAIIEAEYATAKKAMFEWYFEEHGEMPEEPKQEESQNEGT